VILRTEDVHSRLHNIIYINGIPSIRLLQKFININKFDNRDVAYHNRYISANPNLIQIINMDKSQYKTIKIFYTLLLTGFKVHRHSIFGIEMDVEVDGVIVNKIRYKVAPNPKAAIEDSQLKEYDTNETEVRSFPSMADIHKLLIQDLKKLVDNFDRKDKIYLIGFKNAGCDDLFLRAWFEQNGDTFFGSWFWHNSIDTSVLATQYLLDRRRDMHSFKMEAVAKELGLVTDGLFYESIPATIRQIYRITTGLDEEI
jgi:DNA polymerase-3 subunit epsilon